MTAPFVTDVLGPRARRQVAVASVVAGIVVAGTVAVAVMRLAGKGQFDSRLWRPLAQWSVLRFLVLGLVNTIKAALVAMALSMVAGGLLALGRLARNGPVRWLAGAYVELFRAMPLILLMFFCALGLPEAGIHLKPFSAVVLALTAYNSAVLGEIFRAGILSLERGQSEAASAIGLTYWQSMARVIVPQAARRMIPAIVSQLVTLLKDTSLGAVIIYDELLRRADQTRNFYANPVQVFALAAVAYVIVNFTLSRLARRLEVRQRRRYNASAISVSGIEDLAVMAAHAEATVTTQEAPALASAPGRSAAI